MAYCSKYKQFNGALQVSMFYATLLIVFCHTIGLNAQAVPVKVIKTTNGFVLTRNGSPYYIKGAGGHTNLKKLVEIGGNSIRTWSTDDAKQILDNAQKHGLTVMMGLWLGHERHGFDYDDSIAVKKQFLFFKKMVLELKDHPALLYWGIGNEVDLFYSNTKVWYAVQDIAKMIHAVDPNHPTSTVTAGLDKKEVDLIKARCPDIDIYCVNTYGDLDSTVNNIKKFGWTGPYSITEWGPNGHWEVPKTPWNIPIEQTSSEKATTYNKRYLKIVSDSNHCLGSYIFLWGQKQETTSTWYGVFDEKGNNTEVLDIMHFHWKGVQAQSQCPKIKKLGLVLDSTICRFASIESNKKYQVMADCTDNNNALTWKWQLIPESIFTKAGGDAEIAPEAVYITFKKNGNTAIFKAPETAGNYRIFVWCYDKEGNVAYGNIPITVTQKKQHSNKSVQLKIQTITHQYDE